MENSYNEIRSGLTNYLFTCLSAIKNDDELKSKHLLVSILGEEALKLRYTFTKAGGDLVVVDSVPSMITRKEFDEQDFEKEGQRGRIAALLSSKLPKIVAKAEETGTTWIFINQLRDEMNAMLFGPSTHTPG